MTIQELKELLKTSSFRFSLRVDHIIEFQSVVPIDLCYYRVNVFDHEDKEIMDYDSFEDIISRFVLFEVVKVDLDGRPIETLYHKKHNDSFNLN